MSGVTDGHESFAVVSPLLQVRVFPRKTAVPQFTGISGDGKKPGKPIPAWRTMVVLVPSVCLRTSVSVKSTKQNYFHFNDKFYRILLISVLVQQSKCCYMWIISLRI